MKKLFLVLIVICLSASLIFATKNPKVLLSVEYGLNFCNMTKENTKIKELSVPLSIDFHYFLDKNPKVAFFAEAAINFGLSRTDENGYKESLNFEPSGQDFIIGLTYRLDLNKSISLLSSTGFEFVFSSESVKEVTGTSKTLGVSFGLASTLLADIEIQDSFSIELGFYSAIFYADYSKETITPVVNPKSSVISKGFAKGYIDYNIAPIFGFGFNF